MPSDTSVMAINVPYFNNKTLIEILSDSNNLYNAFKMARSGSSWKQSVQRCELNILKVINELQVSLMNGTYRQKPFYEFVMAERGKIRPIRSQDIVDRIVQRSLCDNILIPCLKPYLIYDNGASLKKKGIDFAKNRLLTHLRKFLRHYDDDGYILLIDFSKFFDNIPHDLLLKKIKEKLPKGDHTIDWLLDQIFDSFKPDVSYMSDEEYNCADETPFDSLEHRKRRVKYQGKQGIKFLAKSLGIGSQISQISGVFYPGTIDNYFKCVKGFKFKPVK